MTQELVAARHTIESLPTRDEVERRLGEERIDRRKAFRWMGAAIFLLLLSSGLSFVQRNDLHDLTKETKVIVERIEKGDQVINCVVAAAATHEPGPEQQEAYKACIAETQAVRP